MGFHFLAASNRGLLTLSTLSMCCPQPLSLIQWHERFSLWTANAKHPDNPSVPFLTLYVMLGRKFPWHLQISSFFSPKYSKLFLSTLYIGKQPNLPVLPPCMLVPLPSQHQLLVSFCYSATHLPLCFPRFFTSTVRSLALRQLSDLCLYCALLMPVSCSLGAIAIWATKPWMITWFKNHRGGTREWEPRNLQVCLPFFSPFYCGTELAEV